MEKNQGTEPPSPRKLRRARERGEMAYSREVASASALLGALAGMAAWLPGAGQDLLGLLQGCLAQDISDPAGAGFSLLLGAMLAIGGGAAAGGLLAGVWQAGFRLRFRFRPEALNPLRGMARLLSRERVADLGLLVLKVASLVTAGVLLGLPVALELCPAAGQGDPMPAFAAFARALFTPLAIMVALTLGWAGMDLWLQRRRFHRRQRMTHQEVRQEHREEEGDPQLRAERRRRHRALLAGGLASLRNAAVVVANPTHLAVALRYLPGEDEAPVVACSGRDEAALRIRREAARLSVPVVENVPLARALVRVPIGDEIPVALYQAVAEVLRSLAGDSARGPRPSLSH
ncbi:MAG: EscU/YscU/HrcU family type III secretion system export apparatus switch protein [Myxococcales bacterium]|nr:EscU/YscU/HrcU family type III secretion system export apparatus switch protein [Myxococcales bacterium]